MPQQNVRHWSSVICVAFALSILHPCLDLMNRNQLHASSGKTGPCNVTVPASTNNTIRCQNGACTGTYQVNYTQSECQSTNTIACSETPTRLDSRYEASTHDLGWGAFISCVGSNWSTWACIACVMAAGATSGAWLIVAGGACASVCVAAGLLQNYCCYTECVVDYSIVQHSNGGKSCL